MHKKITILIFALIIVILPIITVVTAAPQTQPFSENENRYLARFPKLSFSTYEDKSFMNGFDSWISDRFIGREQWINVKNKTEAAIGKTEISGVFTRNDRMMQVWKSYDEDLVAKNINAINNFADRHSDLPMYFMLVPTSQEIYADTLPPNAQPLSQRTFIRDVYAELPACNTVDAYSLLSQNRDNYIYYRTDHHWTSLGAYLGYQALAEKLGYMSIPENRFNIEHASNSFRGTLYSKTLDSSVTPDIIDFYTLSSGSPSLTLSVMNDDGVTYKDYDSLYFREYLDKKDKYSSLLGSNTPLLTITTDLEEQNERSLLIFKDSYAHALIPFLTNHYSKITVLDMRYINTDIQQFVSLEEYDQVLFLYNVITFSEDGNIAKLNMTK